ncbi:RNA polymerase sigma factor [Gryllotalpicola daejeonensis]|uniref:RNA polymerase sigma factor n=1 Tax=Gryllotalpicola daejeonensis TaxID=993087 RepID=UPI0031D5B464
MLPEAADAAGFPDDRLRLVFTCCHPALAAEARIALTLRFVCGLATPEVARALLVTETTMQARLTRAKKKIVATGIPYRVPSPDELPERLASVLDVVHLVYTSGYTAAAGNALTRPELAERGIALARMLRQLLPDEGEVSGLLALLLLSDARRAARVDASGALVLLEDQDRGLWNQEQIAEGQALVEAALRRPAAGAARSFGRYGLMAAIAALHDEAPSWEATDWPQILALYDLLLERWPSPVVALNRAVALSFTAGPRVALAAVDELADVPALASYPYLAATRADLLRRLGETDAAAEAYQEALLLTANDVEAAFLAARLREVSSS